MLNRLFGCMHARGRFSLLPSYRLAQMCHAKHPKGIDTIKASMLSRFDKE